MLFLIQGTDAVHMRSES